MRRIGISMHFKKFEKYCILRRSNAHCLQMGVGHIFEITLLVFQFVMNMSMAWSILVATLNAKENPAHSSARSSAKHSPTVLAGSGALVATYLTVVPSLNY